MIKSLLTALLLVGGLFGPAAHASLGLTNGNFENAPAADNDTDITDWFDYDSGPFFGQAWLEGVDTPDDYNFSLALAGGGFLGSAWAYQGIGTADGATSLTVTFDYGSFADATNNRDLGVTWSLYAVTGDYVPGQNLDINTDPNAVLLDIQSVGTPGVAPGAKVGVTSVTLDLSAADGSMLYLRVSNFSPTTNANDNGYLWVDNVSIATVPEPSTAALLGLGGFGVVLLARRRRA